MEIKLKLPPELFLFLRRFTMKKATNYTIAQESREDQFQYCRFNPGLEITFSYDKGRHKHKIASGCSDEISVFQDKGTTLVLSYNPQLGYAGLEAFQGDRKTNEVFLIGSEMLAAFGEDDLEPVKMVSILQEWL
jgi:hypothetical protein